jgi:hypothetical protein
LSLTDALLPRSEGVLLPVVLDHLRGLQQSNPSRIEPRGLPGTVCCIMVVNEALR